MKRFFSDLRFYESYSFAQAVTNILYDQFGYLRSLDEFYGDGRFSFYIKPFRKRSALHGFVEFIVDATIYDENCEVDLKNLQKQVQNAGVDKIGEFGWFPQKLPINHAYEFYGLTHTTFHEWLSSEKKAFLDATADDISDYLEELRLTGEWDTLIETIVREVFFILFQNRQLLLTFNEMMARQIERSELDDIPQQKRRYFERPGMLKRVRIPKWVKRAVFHRDRGICVLCSRDLSGILLISNTEHFDHIVPLAAGGLNDVTNIQLLCLDCNLRKSHHDTSTSSKYESWY